MFGAQYGLNQLNFTLYLKVFPIQLDAGGKLTYPIMPCELKVGSLALTFKNQGT